MTRRIVITDDSPRDVRRFCDVIEAAGLNCEVCPTGAELIRLLDTGPEDLAAIIICWEIAGPPFGPELLVHCRRLQPEVPVIVVSNALDATIAVRAFQFGAQDFLEKPLDGERVKSSIRTLLDKSIPDSPLIARLNERILGESSVLHSMLKHLAKAIEHHSPRILLIGESGTGKELLAQSIHNLSLKHSAPFIAVNVAAIPKELIESELFGHEKGAFTGASDMHQGYMEEARDGTLFLDEIGELDLSLQVKLLRVLQENKFRRLKGKKELDFRARVVCATNRDLAQAVNQGTFRQDLFHRINEQTIKVPPLRRRIGDIDLLADHFLSVYGAGRPARFARETLTILRSYPFPGNIRELENFVKSSLIECDGDTILPPHLPLSMMNDFIPTDSETAISGTHEQAAEPDNNPPDVHPELFQELAQLLPQNWRDLTYKQAFEYYERAFDRIYLSSLSNKHHHNKTNAARAAGIDKKHLLNIGKMPDCRLYEGKRRGLMNDTQEETVIIGDPDQERFKWFEKLLLEKYGKKSIQVETYEEFIERFDELTDSVVSLVFFSDDLPLSVKTPIKNPAVIFTYLKFANGKYDYVNFCCLVTGENDPDFGELRPLPHHIRIASPSPSEDERREIIKALRTLGKRLIPLTEISRIAEITDWDRNNPILRRQIRTLSESEDISEGENLLHDLIRNCFDCDEAHKIEVYPLTQGKSGARVFRLKITYINGPKEYVLKLSKKPWPLEREVLSHLEAVKTDKDSYTKHIANLKEPVSPIKFIGTKQLKEPYIVRSFPWYGIYYDFLGGKELGKFIDLETVLLSSPAALEKKIKASPLMRFLDLSGHDKALDLRIKILRETLNGLSDIWYAKGELVNFRTETIWKIEDTPEGEKNSFPPYQLSRLTKGRIQDFLAARETALIGKRLFRSWEKDVNSVLEIVGDTAATIPESLNRRVPCRLSPVHGDLNANNILLWLERNQFPFLIDLPFYQREGHTMQDLARLETEVKFALMDRQVESPSDKLIAFDNCVFQVPLWKEMESCLIKDNHLTEPSLTGIFSRECRWNYGEFTDNVTLTYKMILLIRKKAFELQQLRDGQPAPAFADEYLPALLYHTLRSIGYPALSLFKRLTAVYSSGLILNKLKPPA